MAQSPATCRPPATELRMNIFRFRLTALTFLPLLVLVACKPGGDAPTAPGDTTPSATQPSDRVAAQITGAGATFIYPLLSKWSDDYNKQTGHKINYQSIGSGGGIAQIKAATVDFGSSDKPLGADELAAAGLGQFPRRSGAWCRSSTSRGSQAANCVSPARCWPTSTSARSRPGTTPGSPR
jgi:phosphate transport system substrate-binding protein